MTVEELIVKITADTSDIKKGVQDVQDSITGVDKDSNKAGNSFIGTIKKVAGVVAAAEITKKAVEFAKAAVEVTAAYEQAAGTIDLKFGDAADSVKAYASEAYKYGISNVSYLEKSGQMSSFILAGVNNDTAKATKTMNDLWQACADNASAYGSTTDEVFTTIQAVMKGNYQTLDNLNLGYAGTKAGMEEMFKEAEKITGIKYDTSNAADFVEVLKVIQDEQGLTGKAAAEASTTISGSWGMLQASYSNLLLSLGTGEGIGASVQAMVTSIGTYLKNLLPVVGQIISSLPQVFISLAPQMLTAGRTLINNIITAFKTKVPEFLSTAPQMISSFLSSITTSIQSADMAGSGASLLSKLGNAIVSNIPNLITSLQQIITNIVNFISTNGPTIAAKAGQIAVKVVIAVVKALPKIIVFLIKLIPKLIKLGIKMGLGLIKGMVKAIIPKSILDKFTLIKDGITKACTAIKSKVGPIFKAVKNFIVNPIKTAVGLVKGAMGKIKGAINKAKLKLPHIKLPHFSIVGKFSLKKKTVPHLSINWYKKGGVFDEPTQIGVGENGQEAVMPLEHNTGWIDTLASKINNSGGGSNSDKPLTVVLQVDKQRLGKATINSINDIIKQEGVIPLYI